MKLYHQIFIVLKIIIVLLVIANKLYESSYKADLEEALEDIFSLFVGVMVVFLFWPWSNKILDKHDKMIALSSGILLLMTKNYNKLYDEIEYLMNEIVRVSRNTPLHRMNLV